MQVLAGDEKSVGRDHSLTFNAVHKLGSLYRAQGKLKESEQIYWRAVAGKEKALGTHHTSTLQTSRDLGNLYANQGKVNEARQMYERAPTGKEKGLEPEHTSTLDTDHKKKYWYHDSPMKVASEAYFEYFRQ